MGTETCSPHLSARDPALRYVVPEGHRDEGAGTFPGTGASRAIICKLMTMMVHEQVTDLAFANDDDFVVRNAMTERIDTTGTRRPRLLIRSRMT